MSKLSIFNHKIRPQPSERWVMYELVCPLVDLANQNSGLFSYYEFSKPNGPNRRLSVDIALIDEKHRPVWVIEVKKFKRGISHEFVTPYLDDETMGAVTNGNRWIFRVCETSYDLGPLFFENGTSCVDIQNFVVSVLACRNAKDAQKKLAMLPGHHIWKQGAKLPSVCVVKRGLSTRKYAQKSTFHSFQEAIATALPYATGATKQFLQRLMQHRTEINAGYIEVSNKRIIWWLDKSKRAARINLESSQLEMLVRNEIIGRINPKTILASQKIHDKNTAMTVCKASQIDEIESLLPVFSSSPR